MTRVWRHAAHMMVAFGRNNDSDVMARGQKPHLVSNSATNLII